MKNFFKCVIGFSLLYLSVACFLSCKQDEELVVLENIQAQTKKYPFYSGEWLSKDNVQVMATFSNEDSRDITEKADFYPRQINAGYNSISISYKDKRTTLEIYGEFSGYFVQSILLELADPSRIFYEGDWVSTSDFIVTATYSDGHAEIVTENATFEGLGVLSAGYATITVEYENYCTSSEILVHQIEYPPASVPNALYIAGSFSDWDFVTMEKDSDCFFYEFDESFFAVELMEFKITTEALWADGDNEVFAGSIVPSTGFYVAPNFSGAPYSNAMIDVDIANPGDKIYVRYKNGMCYARYVEAGETVSPDEEMEIVDALNIELGDFPEYAFAEDIVTVSVTANIPCDYTYQWYKYEISETELGEEMVIVPIYGATSNTFGDFVEGEFYYFSVTAIQKTNRKNKVTVRTSVCYIDRDEEITVSLSQEEIALNDENDWKILTANVSTDYYDDIFWISSDPSVAKIYDYGWKDMVQIQAVGNGSATISVTVVKRETLSSAACNVVVSGF